MKLRVNGELTEVGAETCLKLLLSQLGYAGKKIAVELNHEIIPARMYEETFVQENDQLEIVHAIGGG